MRRALSLGLAAALTAGCSSVGSSVVRTGPARLPPYWGAVSVYAAHAPPPATELGVVEVHAAQSEATVETLVPLFVSKVAALGGNAAVIEQVRPVFELVPRPYAESFSYACGFRSVCFGTRTMWSAEEVLLLSIRGRALRVEVPR